jgi:multimeric flavodoxin WrbA
MEEKRMTVLGISSSGRPNRIVSQTVQTILQETGLKYDFVSLSGKTINGCTGCLRCAGTNRCVLQDDFQPIVEKMLRADAIVFGSPCYYGGVNGRAHSFIERAAYSFHHNNVYPLGGKSCVSVSTEWIAKMRNKTEDPVKEFIERVFIEGNHMESVGHVTVYGYGCCYTCGYGHNCTAGGAITEKSRRIGCFEKEDLPPELQEQKDVLAQIHKVAELLKARLSDKKNK